MSDNQELLPVNVDEASSYVIEPSRLEGEVYISGAKNSILRLLAASILTDERVNIMNYPKYLLDAQVHLEMLKNLGKECVVKEDEVEITQVFDTPSVLNWDGRSIRNTLLILGALTTRTGMGAVPLPGGCKLGDRKIDFHVMLLRAMGAEVWEENDMLFAKTDGRLKGTDIHLPMRSTGATENGIICGCLAEGITRIWNPHIQPELFDLIGFLKKMGAKINVYGQEHIEITGVKKLRGTNHSIIPDNIEAITWLIASVISGGDIEIHNFPVSDTEVPLVFLRESGARFYRNENSLIVRGGRCYPFEITTGPYPAIKSDIQPLFTAFGACANGVSKIVDLRYSDRYRYVAELNKMGLVSEIDGNMLTITGGKQLKGAEVKALDLRGGASLALAALVAEGQTIISDAWQIERGYDKFADKLRALGGKICNV
ncbi:UDP-N-acetylglucosamine 1-carboxyvinyltransferase [uncultured Desulfobulbus sp.]|uniref:UDP-N-acetylglucosamine 1-carboxyvinyltransferase n=1 Tax=uncultured Desulfobulbus sp. TaxID=239745 RepID=UPI0029C65E2D|nr:UDP-N-acetylglucosamine 1-carboxyvinyltransferase [uncultured Desulfobulbus sp.]